jgi:branched-chain amino acid transport system permease protein
MNILIFFLIMSMVAMSLNLMFGYTGMLSMAQGGFFGVGAYAYALLVMKQGWPTWPSLLAGSLICGIISLPISALTLKLKGHYFAIATLAFGLIITTIITVWRALTNGPLGLPGVPPLAGISLPWLKIFLRNQYHFYLLLLTVSLLIVLVTYLLLVNSKLGRAFQAIRENEELAKSIGINTNYYKGLCFFISGMLCGLAGGAYVSYMGFVHPQNSDVFIGFRALVCTVIGGSGTILGPVIGTLLIVTLPEMLRMDPTIRNLIYGLILILVIMVAPEGIMGILGSTWRRIQERLR